MQYITAEQLFRMTAYACTQMKSECDTINQLNVFPVPDGDTGSNMTMTMEGVFAASADVESVAECARLMGAGMLRSARGNSGVILSVFFRGFAKGLDGKVQANAGDVCAALALAVESAYGSVMNPTEGTILTVMRACAQAAEACVQKNGADCEMAVLFADMAQAAQSALDRTPELLPMLKKAGVVDAGGYGFVVILRAMLASVEGKEADFSVEELRRTASKPVLSAAAASDADIVFPYCTECIIEKSPEFAGEGTVSALHRFVLGAGDSAVFVDDAEIVKIHVHTSDPGSVLSEAIKYGSLLSVKIENMRVQHTELAEDAAHTLPEAQIVKGKYSFVSVANGDGICAALRDLGVDEIVIGGQTMNPSTEQMLQAIRNTDGEYVFVLPNNSNIIMVAQQAAEILTEEGRNVIVLPSKSVSQGISAMYVFDPSLSFEENAMEMSAAMQVVCTLSMTQAVRDADIDGLHIAKDQVLGMINGKVKQVADTVQGCMEQLMATLKPYSCITVFYGSDATPSQVEAITQMLQSTLGDDVDVAVMDGGQPVYSFIISGE